MSKVLRLQIAVEAETRKGLQVGVNEAMAAVLNNNDSGELRRPGRTTWYTVESVAVDWSSPEAELVAAPPAPEPPVEPPPAFTNLAGAIPTEIPPPPPVVMEPEPEQPAALPEVEPDLSDPELDPDDETNDEPL